MMMESDEGSSSLSQDVKIIIASVTVFVVSSTLFFIVGFLCHCFRPKQEKINVPHVTTPTPEKENSPLYQELQHVQLKENIAYIPVQLD